MTYRLFVETLVTFLKDTPLKVWLCALIDRLRWSGGRRVSNPLRRTGLWIGAVSWMLITLRACGVTPQPTPSQSSAPSRGVDSSRPLASFDPGDLARWIEFREAYGLRSDVAWVLEVAADPANTNDISVPLTTGRAESGFGIAFGASTAVYVLFAQERLGLDDLGFGILITAGAVGGLIGSAAYPGWSVVSRWQR